MAIIVKLCLGKIDRIRKEKDTWNVFVSTRRSYQRVVTSGTVTMAIAMVLLTYAELEMRK